MPRDLMRHLFLNVISPIRSVCSHVLVRSFCSLTDLSHVSREWMIVLFTAWRLIYRSCSCSCYLCSRSWRRSSPSRCTCSSSPVSWVVSHSIRVQAAVTEATSSFRSSRFSSSSSTWVGSRCSAAPRVTHVKPYITIAIRLRYDYDTTIPRRIRLRRKWSKLRLAFDSTAIRLRHDYDEKLTCSFFARVESRRMEAGARDTSYSYRSRIVIESQL